MINQQWTTDSAELIYESRHLSLSLSSLCDSLLSLHDPPSFCAQIFLLKENDTSFSNFGAALLAALVGHPGPQKSSSPDCGSVQKRCLGAIEQLALVNATRLSRQNAPQMCQCFETTPHLERCTGHLVRQQTDSPHHWNQLLRSNPRHHGH